MRRAVAFLISRTVVIGLAASAAACTTVNLEDAMPRTTVAQEPAPQMTPDPAPVAVRTSDEYPDTLMRPAAAEQITQEQKDATTSELRARRARLAGGATAAGQAASAADLRRIAGSHAENALRAIEG